MQVDNLNMSNKWASAGRVPPLDLSGVTVCPRETRRQWQHQRSVSPPVEDEDNLGDDNNDDLRRSRHHHQRQHPESQQHQPYSHHQHLHHHHHHNNHHHHLSYTSHQLQHHTVDSMTDIELVHGADGLPIDPRDWTRADVWSWLTNLAMSEGLQPTGDLVLKFPMNGKALCLMSLDMYLARVPHGGKMLYRDFRVRLARAMNL